MAHIDGDVINFNTRLNSVSKEIPEQVIIKFLVFNYITIILLIKFALVESWIIYLFVHVIV